MDLEKPQLRLEAPLDASRAIGCLGDAHGHVQLGRNDYRKSGLLPCPPVSLLDPKVANALLAKWHYLGRVHGIIFAVGHYEGCCVFTNCRSKEYEKKHPGVIELARMVGAPGHKWAMSSLMSKAANQCSYMGYTMIVTYADPWNKNNGKVYLAAGWTPDGLTDEDTVYVLDNKRVSRRSLYDIHGTQSKEAMKKIYGDRLSFEVAPPKARFVKILKKIKSAPMITNNQLCLA